MTEARLPATFSPGGPPNGENAHRHTLRSWSRPQPGQSPAADAARLPRAGGGCVPAAHGDRPRTAAAHLRRLLRAGPPACLRAREARHRARRHGLGDAGQHAGHAGMPLRRADVPGGAQHAQHPARRRHHRLFARPRRGEGRHHRPRICDGDEGGFVALQGEAADHRLRRSRIHRRRRAARLDRIRSVPRRRRHRLRMEDAGRRVGRDHAQLHERHHRRPEGRRLSSPRRASARGRQRRHLRHGQASGLSVDAADVPLQRLVLPVVAVGRRRHACLPARGAGGGDVRCHRHAQGDASLRCADRHGGAPERAGGREEAAAAWRRVLHRRGAAAGGGARRDEGSGLQRHASLRPDRMLRPGRGQ